MGINPDKNIRVTQHMKLQDPNMHTCKDVGVLKKNINLAKSNIFKV